MELPLEWLVLIASELKEFGNTSNYCLDNPQEVVNWLNQHKNLNVTFENSIEPASKDSPEKKIEHYYIFTRIEN